MSVMVLDSGNSIIKAKIARRENGEVVFPHALKQLTESEYEKITNRAGPQNQSMDYLRINGKPYVVGQSHQGFFFDDRSKTGSSASDSEGFQFGRCLIL